MSTKSNPLVTKAEEASKLLSQGAGMLNLSLSTHMLTRSGMRQAADWARQAAEKLERAAGPEWRTSSTPEFCGPFTQACATR